jgi:hypothetical protein
VNSHLEIEKKLLGLRLIDGKHSGVSIANLVTTVIDDYALTDKVFAITLDNASSNNTAMKSLRPFFSGYLGVPAPVVTDDDDDSFTPNDDDLCTMFLHQRCSCHVINLIVKAGLQHLKAYIDDFRTGITFLNASNQPSDNCSICNMGQQTLNRYSRVVYVATNLLTSSSQKLVKRWSFIEQHGHDLHTIKINIPISIYLHPSSMV